MWQESNEILMPIFRPCSDFVLFFRVFPKNHVWAAAAELVHLDKDGAACDLADTGSVCGPRATIQQASLATFPIAGDDAYVDSLDYRLDLNVVSACDWSGDDFDFDGAERENFGLCFFVHMPSPGVRPALKVNYWCVMCRLLVSCWIMLVVYPCAEPTHSLYPD